MKRLFSFSIGVFFLTAILGVSAGWGAEKSMSSVPGAAGKVMEKATEKFESLKGEDKEKKKLVDINSASLDELTAVKGILYASSSSAPCPRTNDYFRSDGVADSQNLALSFPR